MPEDTEGRSRFAAYQAEVAADIESCVQEMGCQPILFVGSGFSKRFFSGPSWDELLAHLGKVCPLIDKDYAYYKQALQSPLATGELFATKYHEWAWSTGRKNFPPALFDETVPASAYIKHSIAEHLIAITPRSLDEVNERLLASEIALLQAIRPHAIITTNYDQFLELVFPDYIPIIGQQIIRGTSLSIGEIFKIHGCVSQSGSLIFTKTDYDDFIRRKKYLSAKLLTYFSEHPLLFFGYGAGDPNIQAILSDIDEALPEAGGVIPNVYMLEWQPDIKPESNPGKDRLIAIEGAKGVRIKSIVTRDFGWVFEAFGSQHSHPQISAKVLRTLLVRSYELVRHDIPRKMVQADFQMLEHAVSDSENFAKLFGITTVSDPSVLSANYPFNLTQIAQKMKKGANWAYAQRFIDRVTKASGTNIKRSDNKYHRAEKYGRNILHKYSEATCSLLTAIRDGKPYTV